MLNPLGLYAFLAIFLLLVNVNLMYPAPVPQPAAAMMLFPCCLHSVCRELKLAFSASRPLTPKYDQTRLSDRDTSAAALRWRFWLLTLKLDKTHVHYQKLRK